MMRFLSSEIYKKAEVIGLDLDGTLYDEFEFINQVYHHITKHCKEKEDKKEEMLYYMLNRWLEKGSSYPYIFLETQEKFCLDEAFEQYALNCFRNFVPDLKVSLRVKFILDKFKADKKKLFLLTDGKKNLQGKKIDALGIRKYFELIIITETYPKPHTYYAQYIKTHFGECKEIIYIGDRQADKEFAVKSGFEFIESSEFYFNKID